MGIIFDIQKCSYNDGPGIRTTVFLKGCQLRCAWCHNPESFTMKPQLQYVTEKCINCKLCESVCPNQVHSFSDDIHSVNFTDCKVCRKCTEICPSAALSILGTDMSANEVMRIVLQDKAYYDNSGGGVTFSGGEPTLQPVFLEELLTLAKENKLHTCLETNGYIPSDILKKLIPLVDLFLLDYKITDQAALKEFTGAGSTLWESTLNFLQQMQKPVILRMPIIQGINDNAHHFSEAKALKQRYSVIQKLEIMPYHTLGASKWNRVGLIYTLEHLPNATMEQTNFWRSQVAD